MALTPSSMLALGTAAPDFVLPDVVSARLVSRADFEAAAGLLVIFLCAHCPYVIHVQAELARIGRDFAPRGLGIAAISSNDAARYPADAPEKLAEFARAAGFPFPLCFDEAQEIARAFSATCTPDFFLFDRAHRLVYRGQLDDSRPSRGQADGRDLRAAIDALLSGRPISPEQKPSVGCSIKWKPAVAA